MAGNNGSATWRVIVPRGIKIRNKAGLDGDELGRFPAGTRFVQTGTLSDADGYTWCPHESGFSAVREIGGQLYAVIAQAVNPRGVNLDPRNMVVNGHPPVQDLGAIQWVRVNYDVSMGQGNTNISAVLALYEPICRPYLEAEKRVIFILTHETFGENTQGLPVVRPEAYAAFVASIVNQWKQWGNRIVWEIWNEPDLCFNDPTFSPAAAQASVPLTPFEFANLLGLTIRSIRSVDSDAVLISGGLMSGQPAYLAQTLNLLPHGTQLDGIAIHPYGQDPARDPRFGPHGDLTTLLRGHVFQARGIPLYITEWGVLDQPQAPVDAVTAYARRFLAACDGLAECAVWFAWADKIHNGYGLVDDHQNRKQALYEVFAL